MKKKYLNYIVNKYLSKFILLILLLCLINPTYSYTKQQNEYKLVEIKKTNDDVGLYLKEEYLYNKPFYSEKYLLVKIVSIYTDRLFFNYKLVYEISYDTFDKPIKIVKKNSQGEILQKIYYEYDNEKKAVYPYPVTDLFPFINLKTDKRLMMKTVIDYEKSEKTFYKPLYENSYLKTITEYNRKKQLKSKVEYGYDKDMLRYRIVKNSDSTIKSSARYLYYERENKYTLGYILYSETYPYITRFSKITSLLDGSIRIEREFTPLSDIKMDEFTPYTEGKEYALNDYRYRYLK